MTTYKGPASLADLRVILSNNKEFEYMVDNKFIGGGDWVFLVRRKDDQTRQRLLYRNSDGADEG